MKTAKLGAIGLATALLCGTSALAQQPAPLHYTIAEGNNLNAFFRDGPVAAHVLARSGQNPRLIVAFPAGNSGVGLWFKSLAATADWRWLSSPAPVKQTDAKGRPLFGVSVDLETSAATLEPLKAVLSSVRVLRDYQALGTTPPGLDSPAQVTSDSIVYQRDRLDGHAGYKLSVQVLSGKLTGGIITRDGAAPIRLRLTALSGETPLTPLAGKALFNGHQQPDVQAQNALSFLSYREKFLAGSWRFNTYFGRDTLMSINLLSPVLSNDAMEAGLGAVLSRVSDTGEVAHEEDIGEFAVLDHLKADHTPSDAPTYNYVMIDSTYMLPPVATHWMLGKSVGHAEAARFLAHGDARDGAARRAYGQDLIVNLKRIVDQARPFAESPTRDHLVAIKDGVSVGNWRDSNDGLGGGRYPYDVNTVFVPAALDAIARLEASDLLAPYQTPADREVLRKAAAYARVWQAHAPAFFEVSIDNGTAKQEVAAYAQALHVDAAPALTALGQGPLTFPALSLGADGQPVPVLNSDGGFALLFADPAPQRLSEIVTAMMRPFPAGLYTDIGVVVADPAYASADLQSRLNPNAYHGSVVWSWQQAVFAAGLERQLQRKDLSPGVRRQLVDAQSKLWTAIDAARVMRNSELWGWSYANGRFQIAPFGANAADADESNAAQLWSTVYLALKPPSH